MRKNAVKKAAGFMLAVSDNNIPDIILSLFDMSVAMYLSELLVKNIIFGGAVFTAAMVWVVYARLFSRKTIARLPGRTRVAGLVIFIASGLLSALLVVVYPSISRDPGCRLLLALIVLLMLRRITADFVSAHVAGKAARAFMLAVLHTLILLSAGLLSWTVVPENDFWIYMSALIVGSLILWLFQTFFPPSPVSEGQEPKNLNHITSYRIYNKMQFSIHIAVNLSIILYICYMRFTPQLKFSQNLVFLGLWIALITGMSFMFFAVLKNRAFIRFGRPTLLAIGIALWFVSVYRTLNSDAGFISVIINAAFYGAGVSCILGVVMSLGNDMKTVIELGVGHIDEGSYYRNTKAGFSWSLLVTYLLVLVMLTISSFAMDGKGDKLEAAYGMRDFLRLAALTIPMLFALSSLIYAYLQPLDKQYAQKLKKYELERSKGNLNLALEDRLKKVLVQNKPRRIGVRILRLLLKPIMPCKVINREIVDVKNGPVVFVCNHLEIFGPITAVMRVPFYFRPMIISTMLDRAMIKESMENGMDYSLSFLPKRVRRALISISAPLVLWILRSMDPIPAYRTQGRDVVKTIKMSVEAMEYDDNILVFPENPTAHGVDEHYKLEGVNEFYTGFTAIGREYYRATGRRTTFYPIYINKRKRTLTFGDGVAYNPSNARAEEKTRIISLLMSRMEDMSRR